MPAANCVRYLILRQNNPGGFFITDTKIHIKKNKQTQKNMVAIRRSGQFFP